MDNLQPTWVKFSEQLPPDNMDVLVYSHSRNKVQVINSYAFPRSLPKEWTLWCHVPPGLPVNGVDRGDNNG